MSERYLSFSDRNQSKVMNRRLRHTVAQLIYEDPNGINNKGSYRNQYKDNVINHCFINVVEIKFLDI